MTDTKVDARRWNAFVCQDCRAIFRVPSDYAGKGIVCPRCDRMLRMPTPGETVAPEKDALHEPIEQPAVVVLDERIVTEADNKDDTTTPAKSKVSQSLVETVIGDKSIAVVSVEKLKPAGEWKKRKHKHRTHEAEDAWQQRAVTQESRAFSKRIPWWAGPTFGALLMVFVWIVFSLFSDEKTIEIATDDPVPMTKTTEVNPPLAQGESDKQSKYLQEIKQVESIIASFLSAKSPEEMMPWLRNTPELAEKMSAYYQEKPFVTLGFSSVDQTTIELNSAISIFTAEVVTADYEQLVIHLIRDEKEFRVDWESWVGWCEMSFEKILQLRTTKPVEIRAMVESESYYNFDFPKELENEWQSYRLVSIDGSTLLHGYVKRGSEIDNQLRLTQDERSRPMILRVHHAKSDSQATQVLIDSIVESGWVKDLPK